MRDLLFFSHANGFPAPTYRLLLDHWATRFRVVSPELIGHDPQFPVSQDWPELTSELVERLHQAARDAPRVWLVGHSLGGYLSLLAADRLGASPLGRRIAGIVLLDSPLIAGFSATLLAASRRIGLDHWLMPLEQTRQRRTHWADVGEVHAHYAGKPAFSLWHHDVLHDYARHATTAGETGRHLSFDRDTEYAIYRTLPTTRVMEAATRLQMPVGFIGGTRSRELRAIGIRATRRIVGPRIDWVEGTHLFPMEHPQATAEKVMALLRGMCDVNA